MTALFDSIRAVVASAIQGDWLALGTNIVNIVANALHLPSSLVAGLLRILGLA